MKPTNMLILIVISLLFAAGCAQLQKISPQKGSGGISANSFPQGSEEAASADLTGLCNQGRIVGMGDISLTIVGVEDYKSGQMEAKLCRLHGIEGEVDVDLFVDAQALTAFMYGSERDYVGSGCIVMSIKDTASKTELCFGDKAKKI
ncbi:hypothetical protein HYU13_02240 [Candidatus Woesearchaeota archaeon]|nr:hypothetical protein [Candidatus Woesearchaeota archaeon]